MQNSLDENYFEIIAFIKFKKNYDIREFSCEGTGIRFGDGMGLGMKIQFHAAGNGNGNENNITGSSGREFKSLLRRPLEDSRNLLLRHLWPYLNRYSILQLCGLP